MMFQLARTVAVLATLTIPAWADDPLPRTITVSGQGKATAPPDMATIRTGVITNAATAKDALVANNKAMEQIMKVLADRNIAHRDMQTSGFNVYPEYRRQPGPRGQRTNEISGYRVTNNLQVRVRNLPRLGEILDALVSAGSNNLGGVSFGIAEPRAITDEARRNAMDDARGRAELYAKAAGVKLGKVISISEQAIRRPSPGPMMARMAMAEADSVPVATGEQEITASVNVMYAIAE